MAQGMESKFNSIYENKLIVILEEAKQDGSYVKFQNILKDLITCTEIQIERKGHEKYVVPVAFELFVFSNDSRSIRCESTDRRYCISECSPHKVGDYNFWKQFYAELEDDITIRALFEFLIKRNITNFNPRVFPKTAIRAELKIVSECLPTRFLRWLFTEHNIYAVAECEADEIKYSKCDLYDDISCVPIIFSKRGLFLTNTYLVERFNFFCYKTNGKRLEAHYIKSHFRSVFGVKANSQKTVFTRQRKGYWIPTAKLKSTLTKMFGEDFCEQFLIGADSIPSLG